MATDLFISYRRDDTVGNRLALVNALTQRYGEDRVYFDRRSIPAGEDFERDIGVALSSCRVLLAFIGQDWMHIANAAGPRIHQVNDYVRHEIATALRLPDVRVIPVLIEGASMPHAEDLPEDLRQLPMRNAILLTDARYDDDERHVLEAVAKVLGPGAHKPDGVIAGTVPLPGSPEAINLRNLREMRRAVRKFWIEGVLDKSLYKKEALIRLNMAEYAEAVDSQLWNLTVLHSGEPNQQLPPGTRIADMFDRMQQRMLILGAPGSGKTTTLLELTRDLLDRADRDPTDRTPVVFNLSSWAQDRKPLADWLADELRVRYRIPADVAQMWVKNDNLLVLLDGLDEVQEPRRAACIGAINAFCEQHLVPMAVCSRASDYNQIGQQLKLGGAVILQPLTPEQMEGYLIRAGDSLSALRLAIHHQEDLQEMAKSPLLLSLMVLAYQDAPSAEVNAIEATQTRRTHLFNTYLARMFVRREVQPFYGPDKVLSWLRWLAQRLVQFGQTTFLIERMQPSWLQPTWRRPWGARALMALWGPIYSIGFGSIVGLALALSVGSTVGPEIQPSDGLIIGLIVGLVITVIVGRVESWLGELSEIRQEVQPAELHTRIRSSFYHFAIYGLIYGLFGGLIVGLMGGLVGGLVGAYIQITPVKKSSRSKRASRVNLKFGVMSGLFCGLIIGVVVGLIDGLIGGLMGGLVVGLIFEPVRQTTLPIEVTMQTPNQAIRRNTNYALASGMLVLIVGGLIGTLMGGLPGGLVVGLMGGLIGGLIGGANIVIKHYLLRIGLWLQNSIPLRLVRFLDHATSLIFLRKVGGGYHFVHRLVMEHFAGLSNADIRRIVEHISAMQRNQRV